MFSPEQQKIVAIVPKLSGSLSAIGDTYIIYDILSDRKKWATSYHRIMLGMSMVDFMVSVMFIWSSWAIPASINPDYGIFQPSGNIHTCNFQGFVTQFGIAAPLYNLLLCFYYYAVIVKGWKEFQVKKLEISMHIFALVVGLVTATIGLTMKQYNNYMNQCWVHGEPFECEFDESVPCTRGNHAYFYRLFLYTVPLWSIQIIATTALVKVFLHVQAQEKRVGKWRQASTQKQRSKLTKEVSWQSFWYLLAFYVTWIPTTVGGITELSGIPPTFGGLIVTFLTMPLQGFLNCLIYARPRYMRWVKKHPQFSMWLKFKCCYNFCRRRVNQIRRMSIVRRTPMGIDGLESTVSEHPGDDLDWMQNSSVEQLEGEIMDPNVRILSFRKPVIIPIDNLYESMKQYHNNADNNQLKGDSETPTIISNIPDDSKVENEEDQEEHECNDECRSDGNGRVDDSDT